MKLLHIMNELQPSGADVMFNLAAPVWMAHSVQLGILCCGKIKEELYGKQSLLGYKTHMQLEERYCLRGKRVGSAVLRSNNE